jgi:hypothetical protein
MDFAYCEHPTILEPLRGMKNRIEIKAIINCPGAYGIIINMVAKTGK